ncbi:MAG TPA: hypothetical protein VLA89_06120 [Gemmatimonadales bacterium]|nr:hypothetical protein [Gemmatimonadales bacterium]
MPDDRVQAMTRAYVEGGLSYAQIAQEYGLTRQRVGQILGPLGLAGEREKRSRVVREQKLREIHARIMSGELTLEQAAAELGYASGASLRSVLFNLDLRIIIEWEPDHGTIERYRSRKFKCRCDECRRANRERTASLKELEAPHHGTYSGYINYGCRCQACKEAHRVTIRARRAAKRRKEVKV